MLEDDAQLRESGVKLEEVRKKLNLSIEDMDVLFSVLNPDRNDRNRSPTFLASEGTSPCKLSTMSTSCMASKMG